MTLVNCQECDLPFSARGRFDLTCLPCYKKARGYDITKADEAHIRLAESTKALQDKSATNEAELAKLKAQVASLQTKLAQAPSATQGISTKGMLTESFLKTLISLCHPDKHSNSERALEATKVLIALRGSR